MSETTPAAQTAGPRQQALIAALRSGQYPQGHTRLQTEAWQYCCLGVACLVAEAAGVPVKRDKHGRIKGTSLEAQPEVQRYFGFRGAVGEISPPLYSGKDRSLSVAKTTTHRVCRTDLADANDFACLDFTQIADLLERYPERVFIESV